MIDPHDNTLEHPGQITLTSDPKRQSIQLEVHYVTVHLSSTETLELIARLVKVGTHLYGVDWFSAVTTHLGLRPQLEEHEQELS